MSAPTGIADALNAARLARASGLTQAAIAQAVGASQGQVSRILAGKSKRRSKLMMAVCAYVHRACIKSGMRRGTPASINDAIDAIWDGTPEHAEALAVVIKSLGVLSGRAVPSPGSANKRRRSREHP
jgi:transcriptional regulator with XRE-family HTH domain